MIYASSPSRIDIALQQWLQTQLFTMRQRLFILICFFSFLFVLLFVRLTLLMVISSGVDQVSMSQKSAALSRGNILDRNGEILATNLMTASLYANTAEIIDVDEATNKLIALFPEMNGKELRNKLSSGKTFIWLKRNLTPKQQQAIHELGLPGLSFQNEERRIYPYGALTGHLIGGTDIDLHGIAGVEKTFDKLLVQSQNNVTLSIDIRIQNILREELQRGIERFKALGASGIILDVKSGELMAMVSLPDYDPNNPGKSSEDSRFNRNTLGVYEMGSVFKLITAAIALDSGRVSLYETFDATTDIKVGRFLIKDYKPQRRWLTVPEIIKHSSNVGTSRMILKAGRDYQRAFFEKAGLLKPLSLELPEMGSPQFAKEWRDVNAMTASYGYGISVTPLHLVSVIGGIINGGVFQNPTLIKGGNEKGGSKQLVSPQTSEKIRRLMHLVTKEGTGRKADVEGYIVGSKTGSANKISAGGGYRKKHLAALVAAFPMTDPKYIILILLDEPEGTKETFGFATGGWTSAQVAKRVIERMGTMLLIEPVDEKAHEIQTAMKIDGGSGREKRAFG